jgi:hypothetical protein
MKRIALAVIFACCSLALAAQDGIQVNYQGEKPTISDFVWALLSAPDEADDEEGYYDESTNAFRQAWIRYRQGESQEENETLTVDQRNGFVCFESRYEEHLLRIEMCFWNEADQKHKIIAYNVMCYSDGLYSPGQFDGLSFLRYDNATKEMLWYGDFGFDVEYGTEDGAYVSYDLPRSGKDITVTYWHGSKKEQKTLKWDGHRFNP